MSAGRGRGLALWIGVVAGPLLWLGALALGYMLVPWACAHRGGPTLHVVTAATLLVAVGVLVLSWRQWRGAGRSDQTQAPTRARERFMAVLGTLVSLLSILAIVAGWIPVFILAPCE